MVLENLAKELSQQYLAVFGGYAPLFFHWWIQQQWEVGKCRVT